MKKLLFLIGVFLLLPATVFGAEFRAGDQTLSSAEMIQGNFYAAGGNFNLLGAVDGDLIVVGGTINLIGTVSHDVLVLGGTVNINGRVGEDVRVMGGTVVLSGQVGGEVVVTGGQISVLSGSIIVKNAYLVGGKISMDGLVGENLEIRASEISLGAKTRVAKNFDYYSQKEASIVSGAKINGKMTFHPEASKKPSYSHKFPWLAFVTFWWLIGIVGATILAWILFYLWPSESKSMIAATFSAPGRELIRGFVLFFIIPIAAIISFITLIGLPLAIIAGLLFTLLTVLAAAVSGLLVASLMAKFLFKRKETDLNWWLILLGIFALAIIKLIPFVGWIISFFVYLTAFGVLTNKIYLKLLSDK